MTSHDYSKHKDRVPDETVAAIRDTFDALGLATELVWTSHQFGGTWSNRVSIAGTSLGTNGKGTSEAYATASGYAELMERVQNKAIGKRTHIEHAFARFGFYDHPDERIVPAREIVARHDEVTERWLGEWGCATDAERLGLVTELSQMHYRRGDDMVPEVPFADLTAGRVRWLTPAIYYRLTGSNGMCAGNTIEECLVQGLSEVFERYVRGKVLRGEVVMPRIPHEELRAWSVGALIDRIEEGGRYQVHVFDGSLGRGYPVVVTAIVDRSEGTFGVNCGAHPSMAVAVERTLTEAFQGCTIEMFAGINRLAPVEESSSRGNRRTIFRNDHGVYPTSLFVGEPSWEYRPWESDEGLSNAELLRRMVALLHRDGFSLLVRDASHLGFPACHIVVPGMSESVEATPQGLQGIRVMRKLEEAFDRFPDITADQVRDILDAVAYSGTPTLVSPTRPLKGYKMSSVHLFGYLHLTRGEYAEASECFATIAEVSQKPAALFWRALGDYSRWRGFGTGHDEALELVRTFYPPAVARRVERDLAGGDELLRTQFPRMSCYDCAHCEAAAKGACQGLADQDAFERIDAALARSTVSQEALLARLQQLLDG